MVLKTTAFAISYAISGPILSYFKKSIILESYKNKNDEKFLIFKKLGI